MIEDCPDCNGSGAQNKEAWIHGLNCTDTECTGCPILVVDPEPCVSCNAVGRVLLA